MEVKNLQVAELYNPAVVYSGILVQNSTGSPVPNLTPGQPRQMLGLVVAPDGRIIRGVVGQGIDIAPNGLQPNFNALTPLD